VNVEKTTFFNDQFHETVVNDISVQRYKPKFEKGSRCLRSVKRKTVLLMESGDSFLGFAGEKSDIARGVYGTGAHSDYGLLTLLATDDVPGLQVRDKPCPLLHYRTPHEISKRIVQCIKDGITVELLLVHGVGTMH